MKLIMKKILVILMIILVLFPALFSNISIADGEEKILLTKERAGNYVATFAINFFNNWSSDKTLGAVIATAYDSGKDEKSSAVSPSDSTYIFSNKSWIDFAYKNALALQNTAYYPTSNLGGKTYFEKIGEYEEDESTKKGDKSEGSKKTDILDINDLMNTGRILPGDILYTTNNEYLLYVGGTKVIYASPESTQGALKYEYLQTYLVNMKKGLLETYKDEDKVPAYGITDVYRITEKLINTAKVYEDSQNLLFNKKGYYDSGTQYRGIPNYGKYEGSTGLRLTLGLIIKSLYDIVLFLIRLATYIVRAVIVGWVAIVENIIQKLINYLSGTTADLPLADKMGGISPTAYLSNEITVESILYNGIPIIDANFFNFKTAGGHVLTDTNGNYTMIYLLRRNLATWYTIIRNISLGILLFVLIYTAIRLLMSNIAQKKADYQKALTNWVQAFAIVFFIHFFMYLVFYVNDTFVNLLFDFNKSAASSLIGGDFAGEITLYDAIKTKAYSFKVLDGTAGMVFYIIMVYLLLRYLLIYFKRAIAIYVLGIFGSFMGVKYAIDKANGKKTTSLGRWMKDFAFNVLLQSIHCLMYTMLMTVALASAITSTAGLVIAIAVLQVMIKADKIFMKIFGINAKGGLLDGVDKPESYFTLLGKAKIVTAGAQKVYDFGSQTIKGENKIGLHLQIMKYADENDDYADAIKKVELAKYEKIGKFAQFLKQQGDDGAIGITQAIANTDRMKMYRLLAENSSYEAKKNIYENIQKIKKMDKQHYTRSLNTAKNLVSGTFKTIAGVGLLVEGVTPALHSTASGIMAIEGELNRGKARRYKRHSGDKKYLPGGLGALQIHEDLANEKYKKDMKKLQGKQKALEKLTTYESQVNDKLDNMVAKLKEGRTEQQYNEDLKQLRELLKSKVRNTKTASITSAKVKKAVDKYMFKNGKTKLDNSDLNGIMAELNEVLKENKSNKIDIDNDTITRLETAIQGINASGIDGLDREKATALLAESINQPDVVKVDLLTSVEAYNRFIDETNKTADLSMKIDGTTTTLGNDLNEISELFKKMYSTNERSKIENKGEADNYTRVVREFLDRVIEDK